MGSFSPAQAVASGLLRKKAVAYAFTELTPTPANRSLQDALTSASLQPGVSQPSTDDIQELVEVVDATVTLPQTEVERVVCQALQEWSPRPLEGVLDKLWSEGIPATTQDKLEAKYGVEQLSYNGLLAIKGYGLAYGLTATQNTCPKLRPKLVAKFGIPSNFTTLKSASNPTSPGLTTDQIKARALVYAFAPQVDALWTRDVWENLAARQDLLKNEQLIPSKEAVAVAISLLQLENRWPGLENDLVICQSLQLETRAGYAYIVESLVGSLFKNEEALNQIIEVSAKSEVRALNTIIYALKGYAVALGDSATTSRCPHLRDRYTELTGFELLD